MMMQLDLRVRFTAMLFAVIAFLLAGPVFSAELNKIRTGEKNGFTRIVFQFSGPARYLVKGDQGEGKLLLIFTESTSGQPYDRPASFAPPVETITLEQEGADLKTVIDLSIPQYRMKAFTLTGPDRVVFDIYPVAASASTVQLNQLVVKASRDDTAEETPAETVPQPQKTAQTPAAPSTEPLLETTVKTRTAGVQAGTEPTKPAADTPAILPENTAGTQDETAAAPAVTPTPEAPEVTEAPVEASLPELAPRANGKQPAAGRANFQTYLIVVLGVISAVILALIGFLLLHKKGGGAKTRQIESGGELKTTADIMASIDEKIREKFKQYEESNPRGAN